MWHSRILYENSRCFPRRGGERDQNCFFFPFVPTFLNNHSLGLFEMLHEVTTTQARKCDILGFYRKIIVTSPGGGGRGKKCVSFPSVPIILNNRSLDLSEILHEVTTAKARKFDIRGFFMKILVASPAGVERGQKYVFPSVPIILNNHSLD